MHKYDLESIYEDFFGNNALLEEKEETLKENNDVNIEDIVSEINELYLDDKSKELLIKIINYIKLYSQDKENKYIPFNIIITSDNKEATSNIISILKKVSNYYNYIDKTTLENISLYKIEKSSNINEYYNKNGIISIYDLPVLERKESEYKKNFIFNLCENLSSNKITIISGKNDEINTFLLNDNILETKYFKYKLNVIDPEVNIVQNEILNKIPKDIITDEFRINLLDYISQTLKKRNEDYLTYRDNIIDYISFNKSLPTIETSKSVEEVFSELNELVGLDSVKEKLGQLVDLISFKNKTKETLNIKDINLHMLFLGNPGTGKTTVARLLSNILYDLNYIKQNKLIEVSSKDLVAEYVGQTAPKTMEVINKAMGGILFIDEAYSLASNTNENTYNNEAIATLIKAMEDYRDDLVVIFAGYTKEMQDFLNSNSGIVSRIGYTFTFEDYTNEELIKIFKSFMNKSGFIVLEDATKKVNEIINENRNTKNFGNARFVRNMYEKTVLKHASNTKNNKSKKVLKTITVQDIDY